MNASCTRLVTGSSDNQLRLWALELDDESGAAEGKAVPNGQQKSGRSSDADGERDGAAGEGGEDVVAVYMGSVVRQGNGECQEATWRLDVLQSFPVREGRG